ncbi:hypothetical protein GCM10009682_32130 [Luedemannella flava]|uniref:Uncharacterized protein n=1 Tax=Luedemannella flava TaxID=349316 RepID=A0ABN2M646_9ACTN
MTLTLRGYAGPVDLPRLEAVRAAAQALLGTRLSALAGLSVPRATLRTVRENPNRSVALYEGRGYRVTATLPRYRKPLA